MRLEYIPSFHLIEIYAQIVLNILVISSPMERGVGTSGWDKVEVLECNPARVPPLMVSIHTHIAPCETNSQAPEI